MGFCHLSNTILQNQSRLLLLLLSCESLVIEVQISFFQPYDMKIAITLSPWVGVPYFRHFPVVLWPLLVPPLLCWVFLLALTLLVLVLTVHCYKSRTPVEWRPVQTAGSESSRLVWQPRRKNNTIVINFWYRRTTKTNESHSNVIGNSLSPVIWSLYHRQQTFQE